MSTDEQYAAIDAVNWSTLKRLEVSPLWLQWCAEHPQPDTTAYALGRAAHCAILEPGEFDARYAVRPDVDGRTKAGKAALAEWDPGERDVLRADDMVIVERCAAAVVAHGVAREALSGGRAEVVAQWVDEPTRLACKGRIDYLTTRVVDLKTTRRQTTREFARDASAMLYHGQIAFYHDGAIAAGLLPPDAPAPLLVAVQTVEPYDVAVYEYTDAALAAGRALYRRLLDQYGACGDADWWPGIAPDIVPLDVERWAPGAEENLPDGGSICEHTRRQAQRVLKGGAQ